MPGHVKEIRRGYFKVIAEAGKKADGKRQRVVRYHKGRESGAKYLLARLITELEHGTYVEPSKLTVGDWVQTWLDDYKAMKLRETTLDLYQWTLDKYIDPNLGRIQLQDLRGGHIQRLYKKILDAKKSSRLVHLIYQILNPALRQAIKNGLIKHNACEATELPPLKYQHRRELTQEEQDKFLEACCGHRYGIAILVLFGTGIRKGECLGLRWQDVDLENGAIYITQGLVHTKKGLKNHAPKTEKGRRSIPLPRVVVEALKLHKDRMRFEKHYRLDGYAFCTKNGTAVIPRNFDKTFHILRERAGISHTTPHGLRHTFATRLLELGENMKVVQELLGHARMGITADTYSHVSEKLKRRATDKLDQVFTSGTKWAPKELPITKK